MNDLPLDGRPKDPSELPPECIESGMLDSSTLEAVLTTAQEAGAEVESDLADTVKGIVSEYMQACQDDSKTEAVVADKQQTTFGIDLTDDSAEGLILVVP